MLSNRLGELSVQIQSVESLVYQDVIIAAGDG